MATFRKRVKEIEALDRRMDILWGERVELIRKEHTPIRDELKKLRAELTTDIIGRPPLPGTGDITPEERDKLFDVVSGDTCYYMCAWQDKQEFEARNKKGH